MAGKVYVWVHGEDGKAIGAGPLMFTCKRRDLAGTFAGMFESSWKGGLDDMVAVVQGSGMSYYVVPVTRISDFPEHPGYGKE